MDSSRSQGVATADRRVETLVHNLGPLLDRQTDLVHFAATGQHTVPATDLAVKAQSNSDAWRLFVEEQLFDTRRLTLEHFHLFEWFPLAPGLFHTKDAKDQRRFAQKTLKTAADGTTYYDPDGKVSMIRGGIGTVRLRPRTFNGETYYFMTASSTGVCHEGFPVLVPRRFYGQLKARMLYEGAVPVIVSGEMKYIDQQVLTFSGRQRDIPLLYLHVDEVISLPNPRSEVTNYEITVAVSFDGVFEEKRGVYATYSTFDPSSPGSVQEATNWIKRFYVESLYHGKVITDFDEVKPRYPNVPFGVPRVMTGRLKLGTPLVRRLLRDAHIAPTHARQYELQVQQLVVTGDLVLGDRISLGDIVNSTGVAIGRRARTRVGK